MTGGPIHGALFVPGPMPGMNEILEERVAGARRIAGTSKRVDGYGALKKRWAPVVQGAALAARLRPGTIPPAHFTFVHYERDQRRDPDNFAGGAQKLILDGLKDARLIANDGWRDVLGLRHHWLVAHAISGKQAVGVGLVIADHTLELEEALSRIRAVFRPVEMIPRAAERRARRAASSRSNCAARLLGV